MFHVMKKLATLSLAVVCSAALSAPVLSPAPARAQEDPAATAPAPGDPAGGPADDQAGEEGEATVESVTPTYRTEAPNTDTCPQSLVPPEPVTTSERLAPGQPAPTPLPATQTSDCGVKVPQGFMVDKDVLAAAFLVADVDSGEIIAMKDPHGRYRPASIIKVLLALVAIEELDLNQKYTATAEDANADGSAVGIGEGGVYTIEQLLQGLVMASGNDAAHALAQALGGDKATLNKVNKKAHELGTTDTVAASYSGLDTPGMSTSAYDLGLIYQAAYRDPTFARLVNTDHVDFPGYGDMPGYELWNDNGLLMNDPEGIGGKTGYTDDAHHTFVGAVHHGGRRLMAIILNTTVEHGPRAWEQAQKLLHESYDVRPGQGVGTLTPAEDHSATPTVTATQDPVAPGPAEPSDAPTTAASAHAYDPVLDELKPWMSWLIVGLVGLFALIAAVLTLRGTTGRHRKR